jgi:hypothetical protein
MKKILLLFAFIGVASADPPAGTLAVNSGNTITNALVALIYPSTVNHKNIVTGEDGTLGSGAVWNATGESGGTALGTTGTGGGASWPFPAGMTAASGDWTMMIRASLTIFNAGWECLICVPHNLDGSGPPYYTLGLIHQGGTTAAPFYFGTTQDDTQDSTNGPDSFYILDGTWHDYALVKTGSFIRFYLDGVKQVGDYFGDSVTSLGTGQHAPLNLVPSNVAAKVNFAAVWSRDASGDFASLLSDKNQLVTVTGGGGGGSTSNASRRRQNN